MDIETYLTIRLKNGKITEGCYLTKDGLKFENNGLKQDQINDHNFIRKIGKDMVEFWNNAPTQMHLLWAMRGLGLDSEADVLWKELVNRFDLSIHKPVPPDVAIAGAMLIRSLVKCPFGGDS